MEGRHRTILRVHRPNIVRDLEPNNILPDLGSVLTAKDDAEIKAQSTRQGRCEQLLEIIPRKGPNAFKVFVEALKKENPHLALDLIDADHKETDKELRQVREQSKKLRKENSELKETFQTGPSQQIGTLAGIVQDLIGEPFYLGEALGNSRDSTERETLTSEKEIEELTQTILEMISSYQVKIEAQRQSLQKREELSKGLEAANEKHQREIEDLREKNNESKEELEKSRRDLENIKQDLADERERAKDFQQKLEVKYKAEIESLQKKLREEKSKYETLRQEVHRLRLTSRQMPGHQTRIRNHRRDFDRRRVVDDLVIMGNGRQ